LIFGALNNIYEASSNGILFFVDFFKYNRFFIEELIP
jgi:hypothetical protein